MKPTSNYSEKPGLETAGGSKPIATPCPVLLALYLKGGEQDAVLKTEVAWLLCHSYHPDELDFKGPNPAGAKSAPGEAVGARIRGRRVTVRCALSSNHKLVGGRR